MIHQNIATVIQRNGYLKRIAIAKWSDVIQICYLYMCISYNHLKEAENLKYPQFLVAKSLTAQPGRAPSSQNPQIGLSLTQLSSN